MNENKPEDKPDRGSGPEPRSGLSVSREDSEGRSPPPRLRRRGTADRLWQVVQADESVVAHWFLPVAALVVVLLIVSIAMYFSHGNQLNALNREVTALREQAQTTPSVEIDRILARVDELGNRLSAVQERNADVQALGDQLADLNDRIETLAERVETLEEAPASTGGTDAGSGSADTAGSQADESSEQAGGGEWIVNLITLGDRAAAESFQERLDELGIESRIEAITSGDKTLQRVVVPGFSSHEDAEQVVPDLKQRLELSDDPWITRQSE